MRITGPNAFERSYILEGAAGEHRAEVIRVRNSPLTGSVAEQVLNCRGHFRPHVRIACILHLHRHCHSDSGVPHLEGAAVRPTMCELFPCLRNSWTVTVFYAAILRGCNRPALLIADEPTSALDAITQSEILALFARLNRELKMGTLCISHDLLSVATICHRIAILHNGEIAECATTEEIFSCPSHSYTQRLIASLPLAAVEHVRGRHTRYSAEAVM